MLRFALVTVIVLRLLYGSATSGADVNEATIDLGGIREVRAKITLKNNFYLIDVTMRPVRAFDAPTNDEVNLEIGREYALRALAQHLSRDDDVQFSGGGERLIETGIKADRYRIVYEWPKERIRLIRTNEKIDSGPGIVLIARPRFQGKFFTAKQDHLKTLGALGEIYKRTLADAIAQASLAKPEERRKTLNKAIAALEERGLAELEQLRKAIQADGNLIDITERPELLDAVKKQRERFLNNLRNAAVKLKLEPPFGKSALPIFEQFSNVQINKPFDQYLAVNLMLMEVAGAIVIDVDAEHKVMIGIGKTVLKDDSPEELLRAEKVGAIKARVALIGERDGAQFKYLKRVKDQIEIIKDEKTEKSRSIAELTLLTEERIQGLAKNMPIIGRWRSKNGKVHYTAVGAIIDPARSRD